MRSLTDALHRKLQRLPMEFFDRNQTGSLMARITSDVGSLLIFLNTGALQLVCDLILAVGIAALLLVINWSLALVGFAVLPFYALGHRYFADRIRGVLRAEAVEVAAVYGLLSERISAVRVVRSFAREEMELSQFDHCLENHRLLSARGVRLTAIQGALSALITGCGTAAVLYWGGLAVHGGSLSVGELVAFFSLLALLYLPLVRLMQFNCPMTAVTVAVERMMDVLEELEVPPVVAGSDRFAAQGAVSLRDVSFRYAADQPWVLSRVDCSVPARATVGLVGASGSGKSTLLSLLPRLYELELGHGNICLDGVDVRDLQLANLRRTITLVPQQPVLFEGTIRSNLTYAAPSASEDEMRDALAVVDLDRFVEFLPLGLETPVGERGVSLSGGQRQRLALARALLVKSPVLLLDDCTSALDAETEWRVLDALRQRLPGQTRIIVSHKISAVLQADVIVVLHGGKIAEQGNHADLLARNGRYARVFNQQNGTRAGPLRGRVTGVV